MTAALASTVEGRVLAELADRADQLHAREERFRRAFVDPHSPRRQEALDARLDLVSRRTAVYRRVRANCCEISGLGGKQMVDRHAAAIVLTLQALPKKATAPARSELGARAGRG